MDQAWIIAKRFETVQQENNPKHTAEAVVLGETVKYPGRVQPKT